MTAAYDIARQAKFETLCSARAIARYREEASHKDWSELSAGQALLREIVPPLSDRIAAAQAHALSTIGAPGRQPEWAWAIQLVPPDKLAVLTVTTVLRGAVGNYGDRVTDGAAVTPNAVAIASATMAQIEYDKWSGEHPDVEKTLRKRFSKVDRRVWAKWRGKVNAVRCEPWGGSLKAAFGAHLIGLLCEAAPKRFSTVIRRIMGGRSQHFVVPSEETLELIEDTTARAEVARPLLMPMIIPPLAWEYSNHRDV